MTKNLNLASKPFNNRALPWFLSIVILCFSLIGLILVVRFTAEANRKAAIVEADINSLKQREQDLLKTALQVNDSLTPQQQQSLKAAHELVDRKTFSWSRLLADLEGSLPGNVRVSRIAVREVTAHANQTIAELDLVVFAKTSSTITDMIASMDKAGVFHAELLSQNLQKGRGEVGTEYELNVVYRPRAGYTETVASIQEQAKSNQEPR